MAQESVSEAQALIARVDDLAYSSERVQSHCPDIYTEIRHGERACSAYERTLRHAGSYPLRAQQALRAAEESEAPVDVVRALCPDVRDDAEAIRAQVEADAERVDAEAEAERQEQVQAERREAEQRAAEIRAALQTEWDELSRREQIEFCSIFELNPVVALAAITASAQDAAAWGEATTSETLAAVTELAEEVLCEP